MREWGAPGAPAIAFWPGLGGDSSSLLEIGPVLARRGWRVVGVDPPYSQEDQSLATHADRLSTLARAPVLMGHSWGAAIAATAAARGDARALVLLDGGYFGPDDFEPDREAALQTLVHDHRALRWPSPDAYLEWARSQASRWNAALEEMALSGVRDSGGEILPPFDEVELDRIVRGYWAWTAEEGLAAVTATGIPVLLVAAKPLPEYAAQNAALVDRFARLVPHGEVVRADAGHDVITDLGPDLALIVADWLAAVT